MDQKAHSDKWILVRAEVLPEVYHKVLEVSEALHTGRFASVSEAVRTAGISRSAYYKYKDSVAPHLGGKTDAVLMTVDLVLQDSPGVLSGLLSAFARVGANIVTVNQRSPEDGSACVSICAKTDGMSQSLDKFANELSHVPGVRRISAIHQQAGSQKGGEV
ncbi:MAG: ACT domain-containing protein [Clostridia bacterium]|nr:ACT domain-containing protein [Clostridia bacterium]